MNVKLEENPTLEEIEVLIKYACMNQTVHKLQMLVKSVDKTIKCSLEDRSVWINASDIYYIESIDKHTFVYCKNAVYDSDSRLYQLIDELSDFGFVQVSKSCIINIHVLDCIRPLINSRLEATLCNGECIYVTRKYVSAIRNKLKGR
jgi:DNA-binding LytR/AlgR family response regulator